MSRGKQVARSEDPIARALNRLRLARYQLGQAQAALIDGDHLEAAVSITRLMAQVTAERAVVEQMLVDGLTKTMRRGEAP